MWYQLYRKFYENIEAILGFCFFCKKYTGKRLYNCCQPLYHGHNRLNYPIFVPFHYDNSIIRNAILSFKYNYNFHSGYFLAKQLSNIINIKNPVYIPVPLSTKRLLYRGYNQSYLLCSYLQQFLGGRIEDCCIKRTNHIQKNNKNINRYENSLSIELDHKPHIESYENILIVDDVIASGHTISRIASFFQSQVYLCALAIT